MSSILVTYATRYGSTAEIAEEIAKRLRDHGETVSVMPADEVSSLDGFDAVVLGSGLYIGKMLKDAYRFLDHHRPKLESLPVALFVDGPMTREQAVEDNGKQLQDALEKVPWLKPMAAEEFVGKYDPAKLRFGDKIAAILPASPLYHAPATDERDWTAIDAWADALPAELHV